VGPVEKGDYRTRETIHSRLVSILRRRETGDRIHESHESLRAIPKVLPSVENRDKLGSVKSPPFSTGSAIWDSHLGQ
jgi:hypothetical protein